jgi:hypothetical protein
MRLRAFAFLLFPVFLACGCVQRARVPLCEAVAQKSLAPGTVPPPGMVVNAYLAQAATVKHVKIEVLSPVAADISGPKWSVRRIEKSYPFLLCAFYDPGAPVEYAQIYTTCMQSTPEWIQIVRSQQPEDLLLPRTNYASVCVK